MSRQRAPWLGQLRKSRQCGACFSASYRNFRRADTGSHNETGDPNSFFSRQPESESHLESYQTFRVIGTLSILISLFRNSISVDCPSRPVFAGRPTDVDVFQYRLIAFVVLIMANDGTNCTIDVHLRSKTKSCKSRLGLGGGCEAAGRWRLTARADVFSVEPGFPHFGG